MTHVRRTSRAHVLVATVLTASLGGCGSATPGATGSTASAGASPSPASPTASTTSVAAPTPPPTLPGGLEVRTGRPPLVNGEAAACIPGCAVGRVAGGMLPQGLYQTLWFFGGYMTIETDGSWERTEDSNGELSMPLPAAAGSVIYRIAFFLDPALVVDDVIQPDIPRNATSYVAWLSAHPELVVEDPIEASLGTIPATAVDIRLGPDAPAQYDDCPEACVTFLKVAAFDHSDGLLGDDEYRFYFADITYSGTDHMLVVKVEGRDPEDLDAQLPRVEELLRTVTVPATPAVGE